MKTKVLIFAQNQITHIFHFIGSLDAHTTHLIKRQVSSFITNSNLTNVNCSSVELLSEKYSQITASIIFSAIRNCNLCFESSSLDYFKSFSFWTKKCYYLYCHHCTGIMIPYSDEICALHLTHHMWDTRKWSREQLCKYPGNSEVIRVLLKDTMTYVHRWQSTLWPMVLSSRHCPTSTLKPPKSIQGTLSYLVQNTAAKLLTLFGSHITQVCITIFL